MGWFGYGIYDGDDTHSRHYDFLQWSGCVSKAEFDDDKIDKWMFLNKTMIPFFRIKAFKKGIPLVLKKMPKFNKFWRDEYQAIEWQMLLALFLDNNIKPPAIVKRLGINATEYLMGEHAEDFTNVGARKRVLRNFIKRAEKI